MGFILYACKSKAAPIQQALIKIDTLSIRGDSARIVINFSRIPDTSYHRMGICWQIDLLSPTTEDKSIYFNSVAAIDTLITGLGTGGRQNFRAFLISSNDTVYSEQIVVDIPSPLNTIQSIRGVVSDFNVLNTLRVGSNHFLTFSSSIESPYTNFLTLLDSTMQKVWETPVQSGGTVLKSELIQVEKGYLLVENSRDSAVDACKNITLHYFDEKGTIIKSWTCKRQGENHLSAIENVGSNAVRIFYAGSPRCENLNRISNFVDSCFSETYSLTGKLIMACRAKLVDTLAAPGSLWTATNGKAGQFAVVSPHYADNTVSWHNSHGAIKSFTSPKDTGSLIYKVLRLNSDGDYLFISTLMNKRQSIGLSWRVINENSLFISPETTYFNSNNVDSAEFELSGHVSRTRNGDYLLSGTNRKKMISQVVLLRLSADGKIIYHTSPNELCLFDANGLAAYEEPNGDILLIGQCWRQMTLFRLRKN